MIDWKCIIANRIYNQINVKYTIYLNFMNNMNQNLSKIGFCNINQKFRTYIDYNLSSLESGQPSEANVRLTH